MSSDGNSLQGASKQGPQTFPQSSSNQLSTNCEDINVDLLLEEIVGSCGTWQWSTALLITLSCSSIATFPVFANSVARHRCQMEPEIEDLLGKHNLTFDEKAAIIGPWSNESKDGSMHDDNTYGCTRYVLNWSELTSNFSKLPTTLVNKTYEVCPFGYVYQFHDHQYPSSVVVDFDTVCSKGWLVPLGTSVYMLGMLIGFILGGWSGDRFGRKKTLIMFAIEEVLCGAWTSLSPNYVSYVIARGFMAIGNTAKVSVGSVLLIESTVAKYRSLLTAVPAIGMNFMYRGLLALWAFLIPNWRLLNLAAMAPSLFCSLYYFVFTESPRWLLSKNRVNEAVTSLKFGFKMNRLCRSNDGIEKLDSYTIPSGETEIFVNSKPDNPVHGKVSQINLLYSTLKIIALCSFILFGIVMCFFGLLLYARTVRNYVYITAFVNSTTAIPAILLSSLLYRFFRRRKYPLMVLTSLAACVLFISSIYTMVARPDSDIALTVGTNIALVLVNASIAMCYVYVPELFPSNFRTFGFGIVLGLARLGSILCTFVNEMDKSVTHGSPLMLYAAVALSVFFALFALRNTSGENLSNRSSI